MIPESYLVRIYRRDPDDPDRIEGLLVAADGGSDQAFHSGADLLRLLRPAGDSRELRRSTRKRAFPRAKGDL